MLVGFLLIILAGCWQKNWFDAYYRTNNTCYDIAIVSYSFNYDDNTDVRCDTTIIAAEETCKIAIQHIDEFDYLDAPSGIIGRIDSIKFLWEDNYSITYYGCIDRVDCMKTKNPIAPYEYYDTICSRKFGCDYTYYKTSDDLETK